DPIGDVVIPIVSIPLNGAFLVSLAIFAGGMIWLFRWLQSPKMADLLIDTESELRKVTWPTTQEVINSSMVVVACVVILMAFLAGTDLVLGQFVKRLILGG
ncbi:MAG: preprotein translocase subunit SecE, partial [Planctomycetota bacterium]|nr:preprotein translocase subunit SecE [Planctomycetota bacterium]